MRRLVLSALGLGLTALFASPSNAADASKLPGGTWASIAQLPDMNGVWEMTFGGRRSGAQGAGDFGAPQQFSLTPAYVAMQKEFQANPPHDSPHGELRAARNAGHHEPAVSDRDPVHAGHGHRDRRSVHAGAPHLHRRPRASRRSRSDLQRQLHRPLGRRHAGGGFGRFRQGHAARHEHGREAQRQDAHRGALSPERSEDARNRHHHRRSRSAGEAV